MLDIHPPRIRVCRKARCGRRVGSQNPKQLWAELQRRRVVRAALYYVAGAWILAQVLDLLLDAFDASHYMRFVVAGLVLGLPVATALAWIFDFTPSRH